MKKIIALAIFFGLLTGLGLFFNHYLTIRVVDLMVAPREEIKLVANLTVEFDSEATVGDFFDDFGGQWFDDYVIDTTILGPQTVVFSYRNQKNHLRHASFTINVVDTVAPTVMYQRYVMLTGENDDIIGKIPCGDNADPHPTCSLSGEYDPDVAGSYQLTITTQDDSGNVGNYPLELVIYEEYPVNSNPPLTFDEMLVALPQGATLGIDVSKWQGEIDWPAVKTAGVDFVIIRLGSQSAFDAESTVDPYFLENFSGAQAAGLRVGVYFYSLAQTTAAALAQAELVLAQLDGKNIDLPVVFDWEAWTYFNDLDLSYYQLNQIADTFLQTVTAAGYQGMLYSAKAPLETNFWWNQNHYPLWLAHYVGSSDYQGEYQLWQFSATGEIVGIDNEVDLNLAWI